MALGALNPAKKQEACHRKNTRSWALNECRSCLPLYRISPFIGFNRSVRTMLYDLNDRLTEIKESGAGGQLVFLRRMAYDNAGRMTSSYQLPDRPSITEVSAAFTHNPDNSIATVDGNVVNIDADGNMTATPLPESSTGFQPVSGASLGWDARNRLTSAAIAGATTTYAYDAENRRVSKTTSAGSTTYAHSPGGALSQLLIETLPGGSKRWFVHGASGIEYQVENDGTVFYLHGDQIGSVLAVTNSSAQTVKRWGYTPYGQAVSYTAAGDAATPSALAGAPEHGYVGQFGVVTDANGLLNMRARFYSPYLRRFLNEDPIGFAGGMNFYAYCGGDPIMGSDPSGLMMPGPYGSWKNSDGSINWGAYLIYGLAGVPGYVHDNFWSSTKRNLSDPKFVLENAAGGFGISAAVNRLAQTTERVAVAASRVTVAAGENMSSAAGTTVWRQVAEAHPSYAAAQQGLAVPNGAATGASLEFRALAHDGGFTGGSGLTSWTADLRYAQMRQSQTGGVILQSTAPEGSIWMNSAAAQGAEAQVLIPGLTRGVVLSGSGQGVTGMAGLGGLSLFGTSVTQGGLK